MFIVFFDDRIIGTGSDGAEIVTELLYPMFGSAHDINFGFAVPGRFLSFDIVDQTRPGFTRFIYAIEESFLSDIVSLVASTPHHFKEKKTLAP